MLIIDSHTKLCWFTKDEVDLCLLDNMLPPNSKEAKDAGCCCGNDTTKQMRAIEYKNDKPLKSAYVYDSRCPIHPIARHAGSTEEVEVSGWNSRLSLMALIVQTAIHRELASSSNKKRGSLSET